MTKYTLPELNFDYNALEPHIDARTMEIHHTKHHRGYVDKLNGALEKHPGLSELPLENLLADIASVPEEIRTAVRNNGGGHLNHSLFWQILGQRQENNPGKELSESLIDTFGSLEKFREKFSDAAAARFGSGWAWLSADSNGKLIIHSTPNQDSPVMEGLIPILGLDVWEHAYYLKYQNRRPDYISAFWNVVNWQAVDNNFQKALKAVKGQNPAQ